MNHTDYDRRYLEVCQALVEQKLGWRPLAEWRNYEFNALSEKILDETGVHLSATTLKRIFGKLRYDNLPSSATLNTLAIYLGYENWMAFKSAQSNGQPRTLEQAVRVSPRLERATEKRLLLTALAVVCLSVVFGFVFFNKKTYVSPLTLANIRFESRSLAEGYPNTVVFNVDLAGLESDDVVIRQSWDTTKTIRLQRGQREATGMYYRPGYYRAKLIVDGRIVKEHDLFLQATDWMATLDRKPVPTYLATDALVRDNSLSVSPFALEKVKAQTEPTSLIYHLVRPLGGIQSDHFTLETALKNTWGQGPAICKTSEIVILGTKGAFILPFAIPGCVSDLDLLLNDRYLPGKSNDLSAFGADLTDWTPIRLDVRNRRARIFLNGALIREEKYEEDAGEIVGLRFAFLGAGAVQYVKLKNGNGETVYLEEFK